MITKILVSAAIALGSCVGLAAPAGAEPNPANPNPYDGLRCSCHETAPAGSPALREEIDRGLREGHAAQLSGLPAPAQSTQPLQ